MDKFLPIVCALATGFFWGTYAPALAQARKFEPNQSPFKPYVMIGVAYLVLAIGGGIIGMLARGDSFKFSTGGAGWGLTAGTLGALGALTLTLAMFTGGHPQSVMPIVFGTAVSVTAIVSVIVLRANADPRLWLGIAGMVVCIITVTYYTPQAHKSAPPPPIKQQAS